MNPFEVTLQHSEAQNQKAGFEFLRMLRGYGLAAACDPKSYTVKGHALKYASDGFTTRHLVRVRLLDVIFAVPNGAHLAGGARAWATLRGQGACDGVPDICVPVPRSMQYGRVVPGLFVEMKRPGEKLTESQKKYIPQIESLDWKVVIAVGWVQMVEEIITYLEIVSPGWRVPKIEGESKNV